VVYGTVFHDVEIFFSESGDVYFFSLFDSFGDEVFEFFLGVQVYDRRIAKS